MSLVGREPIKWSYIRSDHFNSDVITCDAGSCHVKEMDVPGDITTFKELKYNLSKSYEIMNYI